MPARFFAAIGILAVAFSSGLTAQSSIAGDHTSHTLEFHSIGSAQPVHIGGYTFTEVDDPVSDSETPRHVFIQGPGNPQPRRFYSYGREMGFALVPACHLVVVEEGYTTKLSRSVAISLPGLKKTNLSDDAVAEYRRTYDARPTMFVNGFAQAVSHDCKQVLIKVELTYGDARTPEEAETEGQRYPKRSYEVSLASGRVVGVLANQQSPH